MLHFGLHFYLANLAIGVSIILFGCSLFSKYKEIQTNRDACQHHLLPQLLNLTMLLMGILYGTPMISYGSVMMTFISIIQAILLIIFINKLIEVSGAKRRRRCQIFLYFFPLAIASIMAVGILLIKIQNFSKRHTLGGLLFTLLTIAASLSCYPDMELAWTTETAEHLSVLWILATLFNAICWTTLGAIPFDKFTLLPNVFGIVVAVAQLITYARFRNSPMVSQ